MATRVLHWRRPYLALLAAAGLLLLLDLFGVIQHMRELDYETRFTYPLDSDVGYYVELLLGGQQSPVTPLNTHQFRYLSEARHRCAGEDPLRLLLVVKSAVDHFDQRRVIRRSWASQRPDVRHVFLLGTRAGQPRLQTAVAREADEFGDVVQAHFEDSYFNNTLKTMSGMRWAVEQCGGAEHVLFADDDMYVSVVNVLRLVAAPRTYPGYVFHSSPLRQRFSKWYISVEEYPFNQWPPYCTAGAYLLSRSALRRILYTSYYTKMFRFDDIYIGLVAKKAGMEPVHTEHIHFWERPYDAHGYRDVVASHGFHDPDRLLAVWQEQHRLGQA
ncbi:beta-1,3-galactosyltransferase brn-like [Pollicipes pollicipes]|uniref:beta-1,3-galactosyltransferase brn-like n=1 Tax=Pollicipes pollicipes TaxID=41117 RepID=UPI001885A073|nr:beta-1,3-galactosyltransferase brn-like [Pollicipes pollicipes]